MLRSVTTIILLLVSGCILHAQTPEIDSLKSAFNQGKGVQQQRRELLYRLIDALVEQREMDSAAAYTRRLIEFLPPISDTVKGSDSTTILDLCSVASAFMFNNLDSAIEISTRALQAARHRPIYLAGGPCFKCIG